LKCEIWEILGYHEDALNLQKKIHQIITTKLIKLKGQNLSASINSNSTPSFDHKDYISDQNYELLLNKCNHSLTTLKMYNSDFKNVIQDYDRIQRVYMESLGTSMNEYILKMELDRLRFYRFNRDHCNRRKVIQNIVARSLEMANAKLITNNYFMHFNIEYFFYLSKIS
jgi:hypothetical protein